MAFNTMRGRVLPKPYPVVQTQEEDVASYYELVVDDVGADENFFESKKPKNSYAQNNVALSKKKGEEFEKPLT